YFEDPLYRVGGYVFFGRVLPREGEEPPFVRCLRT
ncbi:hypothetical protein CEXT_33741, partial [Caerostris extrusa]